MVSFKVVNGDWVLTDSGNLETISGAPRLKQKIIKIMTTSKLNAFNESEILYRYNPEYGQNLNFISALTGVLTPEGRVSTVQDMVKEAIVKYVKIQSTTIKYGLPADEALVDGNVLAYLDRSRLEDGTERLSVKYELELTTKIGVTSTLLGTAG